MGFTINLAKGFKKKSSTKPNKVSRLCIGTTIKDEEGYKIRVSLKNDPDFPDYIVIPFTTESLDLKGKTEVYHVNKDERGNYIKFFRDEAFCKLFPGLSNQYTVVIPNLICSGYVVRINGKLMFNLVNTHGKGSFTYDIPKIDDNKPLFIK